MKTSKVMLFPNRPRTRRIQPRLRQALVAILIAAMMLTALPLAERFTPPAQAQGTGINHPCVNAAYQIIQNCKLGGNGESELENLVINDLLKVHNLPASDRARLLGWERDKIRAGIVDRVFNYIQNSSAAVGSAGGQVPFVDQTSIVTALANRVKARRILAATKAIEEFNRWQVTCPYNPPPPFPASNETCLTYGGRAIPSFEQFQAYGSVLATSEFQDPELQRVLSNTSLGLGYISGLIGAGLATAAIGAYVGSVIALGTCWLVGGSALIETISLPALVATAQVTGPIAVVIYAVVVGITRGIQLVEEAQLPGKLQQAKTDAENTTPDLAQLFTTDNGKREIYGELLLATLPDFPATSGVPAAQASDPEFEVSPSSLNTFTASPTLQYKDWDGNQHTVRMNGRWFVDQKGSGTERLTLTIEFLNGNGRKRLASRVGSEFLISDMSIDHEAPVKIAELQYLNWNAVAYVARIIDSPPTIAAVNVTRPIGGFFVPVQIATVADADDPAELLTVAVTSPLSSNGVTLSGLTRAADGTVNASLSTPSCPTSTINAAFTLQVTDTRNHSVTAIVNVTVPANVPPALTYAPTQNLIAGGSTTVSPTSGPDDPDGSVYNQSTFSYVTVGQPKITPISPTAPPFAGTVTLWKDTGPIIIPTPTGKIDIKNAGPLGTYLVELPVTDGCGVTTVGAFTLNVVCATINVINVIKDPTCYGTSNGQITVNASGYAGNFLYSINNGQSFSATNVFAGLASGAYDIVVKDANSGCASAVQHVTLIQPAALSLTPNSLPTAQAGIAFSQSFTATGGTGTKTISLYGTLPSGVSFNNGTLAGTPLQTGTFPLTLTVTDQNNCTLTQNITLTVACPTVALAPASLPNGEAGTAYNSTLTATPAAGSYSFAITSGVLPTGLTLNAASGLISGTPTQIGSYNFRVTASGTAGFNGCSGFRDYSINITGCAAITLGPATLSGGAVGAAYSQTVSISPAAAYIYSVTAGALPAGLSLNASTGAITGTPSQAGTFGFTITASLGGCTGQRGYTLTIGCPTITLAALGGATAGASFAGNIAASPSGTYSYTLVTGSLPAGLTLNTSTGAVSGTPSTPGTYNFTTKAQAANGCSGSQTYSLVVGCPTITLSALPTPILKSLFNQTVAASPSGSGYSFAVTAGALPTGLSLNAATGVISGTPIAAGAYSFTITATGIGAGGACTGNRAYAGTIAGGGCPAITLPDLPSGAPGQPYSNSVAATPSGSYNYAVTSGSLPAGLTLYGSAGLIYGYPTSGTYSFTITATDSNNCTGSKSYNLVIGGMASSLRASAVFGDFDGDGKADLSVWRGQSGDWLTINSKDSKLNTEAWGSSASPYFDVMTLGDYDGDGKMDLAVFRRSTGEWLIKGSKDGAVISKLWGVATDVPVPGDYDGDGKTDIAVWRGAESNWYILRSSDGQTQTVSWGTSNGPYRDVPVPADYDGDGKTDIAVFRPANGHWYIKLSSDSSVIDKAWGLGTDIPVAADYDGDGKADIAVWRGTDTNWYVVQSSDSQTQTISWGASSLGDMPVPGDYDGDGKADLAVWRSTEGRWYVRCTSDDSVKTVLNGHRGDIPVTSGH